MCSQELSEHDTVLNSYHVIWPKTTLVSCIYRCLLVWKYHTGKIVYADKAAVELCRSYWGRRKWDVGPIDAGTTGGEASPAVYISCKNSVQHTTPCNGHEH
jgi:hypothetical protein